MCYTGIVSLDTRKQREGTKMDFNRLNKEQTKGFWGNSKACSELQRQDAAGYAALRQRAIFWGLLVGTPSPTAAPVDVTADDYIEKAHDRFKARQEAQAK